MASVSAIVPRWEWRAFGPRFPEMDARIGAASPEARTSIDTYVLSRASDANVKFRHGLLDVKLRDRAEGGLELWRPVLKAAFPVAAGTVADVFGYWRLPPPEHLRRDYTMLQLLRDVVALRPELHAVVVAKRRASAEIDGCTAEAAVLTFDGHTVHTIAIEAADPDRVRRVVRSLGYDLGTNINYIAALKGLLGIPAVVADRRAREGAPS